MSQSSNGLNIYRRITTLHISGGVDSHKSSLSHNIRYPDLFVQGGACIRKRLCANVVDAKVLEIDDAFINNLSVSGSSQFDGNVNMNDKLTVKNVDIGNINDSSVSTLNVNGNIYGENMCLTNLLSVDVIKGKTNKDIIIEGNVTITGILRAALEGQGGQGGQGANTGNVNSNCVVNVIGNVIGNVNINKLTANVTQTNVLAPQQVDENIMLDGNIVPSISNVFTLGNLTNKFANIVTQNISVCGDQIISGNLISNDIASIVVTANEINGNVIKIDMVEPKHHNYIHINANIIPYTTNTYVLGNVTNSFANIYTKYANVGNLELTSLVAKDNDNIILQGNIVPNTDCSSSLGSPTKRFETIYVKSLNTPPNIGEKYNVGCLNYISDSKFVLESGNSNVYQNISTIHIDEGTLIYVEAKIIGISDNFESGISMLSKAAFINNGSLITRIGGSNIVYYRFNANSWDCKFTPNSTSPTISGNTITLSAKFVLDAMQTWTKINWTTCLTYNIGGFN